VHYNIAILVDLDYMEKERYHTTQTNPANLRLTNIREAPDFSPRLRQDLHPYISGKSGSSKIFGEIPVFVRI